MSTTDRPLVVPCPDCRAVMWANSSRCSRCRLAADTAPQPHGVSTDEPRSKDKTRRNA